jgi:hypothetical protein
MLFSMDKQEFQRIVDSIYERRWDILNDALSIVGHSHLFAHRCTSNRINWLYDGGDELVCRIKFCDAVVVVKARAMYQRNFNHLPQDKLRFTIESAPLKEKYGFTTQKVSLADDRATSKKLAFKILDMRHVSASEWARVNGATVKFHKMERELADLQSRAPSGVEVTRDHSSFGVRITGMSYDDVCELIRRMS